MEEGEIAALPEGAPNLAQPAIVQDEPTPKPRESRRTILLVLAGIVGLGVLGAVACVAFIGFTLFQINTQTPDVEKTVDEFMRAMNARQHEKAYALFSSRSRRQTPIQDLKKLTQLQPHRINSVPNRIMLEWFDP